MKSSHRFDCRKAFKGTITSSAILALWGCSLFVAGPALAAPQGGVVTSGAASISHSGVVTNINQSTNKASINWQSFSTKPAETVNFRQPGVSSITLNRVIGNEKSVLEGALNANGKVFLINSNGVLFAKGSTVNTAGLVASTLNLSDEDFNAGNYVFSANGSAGSVINLGTISVRDGGSVALLGNTVSNQGVITATKGTVALSSGDRITLNFNGDSLVSVTIDEGALNALVENKKAIYADGGSVIMTARAADDLLSAQVNNSGIIQALTIDDLKGNINLHAYGGTANVDGTLDASAPTSGDGGTIETSGNRVKIADNAVITTKSAHGKTGAWLIDPDGFTIGAGGDITGALLGTLLGNNNITLSSTDGSGSDGNINVNQAVSWSADTVLTLNATNDININKSITATGTNAGLALNYGGDYHILTPATYSGAILDANGNPVANTAPAGTEYASVALSGSNASLAMNGNNYTLIHDMSQLDLLDGYDSVSGTGTAGTLSGYYALARDLDASGTTYTSAPIGTFSGTLAGMGHKISNLTISATSNQVGLIGTTTGTTAVRDIGLTNATITGQYSVGALLGSSNAVLIIRNAYSTGGVSGTGSVGGLVGAAAASNGTTTISDSYSGAYVTSSENSAGGLIGYVNANRVTIGNCHATGNVTGMSMEVGGLAGYVSGKYVTVSNSYATGDVTSASEKAGGLIGHLYAKSGSSSLLVTNSFATGDVTGKNLVGGLIGAAQTPSWGVKAVVTNVNNSYATGNVTSTGGDSVGGLIGYAKWTNIGSSHATGNVTTTYADWVRYMGGLVGWLDNGSATNSYATGNVSGISGCYDMYLGGLVGYVRNGAIANSYATGNVSGYDTVGGLVGQGGAITNSWASGNVSGTNVVGGLAGSAGNITDSYATGNVTGTNVVTSDGNNHISWAVGGLVGVHDQAITNSYSTGNVTGVEQVGGLVGRMFDGGAVIDSYSSGQVAGSASVGGLVGWTGDGTVTLTNSYWNMNNSGQNDAVGTTSNGGTVTLDNVKGLTSAQFRDLRYYRDGTIEQVLAERATVAVFRASASVQAGRTMGQAQQDQAVQTTPSASDIERQQPTIEGHIVFADSADYAADIKAINADGVQFNLEDDELHKKKQ